MSLTAFHGGSGSVRRHKVHPDIVLMSPAREEQEEEARIPNINRKHIRPDRTQTHHRLTYGGREGTRHVRVQSAGPGEEKEEASQTPPYWILVPGGRAVSQEAPPLPPPEAGSAGRSRPDLLRVQRTSQHGRRVPRENPRAPNRDGFKKVSFFQVTIKNCLGVF